MTAYGFGPLGSRAAIVRPDAAKDNHGQQTWFKDASAPGRKDGTTLNASFLNHLVGNLAYLCQAAGVELRNNQGDDTYLFRAVKVLARGEPPDLSSFEQRLEALEAAPFATEGYVQAVISLALAGIRGTASEAGNTLGELEARITALASVAYVNAQIDTLRGTATPAGDTLGELETRIGSTITQGTSA